MKFFLLIGVLLMTNPVYSQITEESIKDCPESPNCVSSLTEQVDKKMEAINWSQEESPMDALEKYINGLSRTEIIEKTDNTLHAVFTSFLFRFKDDVYFLYDPTQKLIHFKSQSRVGHSDLGANKDRMEKIKSNFRK